MTPSLAIEPRPQWWEASALTTTPPLLSRELSGKTSIRFINKRGPRIAHFKVVCPVARPPNKKRPELTLF